MTTTEPNSATYHAVQLEQCSLFAADVGASIEKAMTDAAAFLRSLAATAEAAPEPVADHSLVADTIEVLSALILDWNDRCPTEPDEVLTDLRDRFQALCNTSAPGAASGVRALKPLFYQQAFEPNYRTGTRKLSHEVHDAHGNTIAVCSSEADARLIADLSAPPAAVGANYLLPCDVIVAPATVIRKGWRLSTLLMSIKARETAPEGTFLTLRQAPLAASAVDALLKAEAFISGFEDDEVQEGVPDLLKEIRSAIKARSNATEPAPPAAVAASAADAHVVILRYMDGEGIYQDHDGDEWVLSPKAYARRTADCTGNDRVKRRATPSPNDSKAGDAAPMSPTPND